GVARPGTRARSVGPASRLRQPVHAREAARPEARRLMEALELHVGEYSFSARADGPPDGELVLLLHGFPETSYEWRHQLPALADAGYREVAPDKRGFDDDGQPSSL